MDIFIISQAVDHLLGNQSWLLVLALCFCRIFRSLSPIILNPLQTPNDGESLSDKKNFPLL